MTWKYESVGLILNIFQSTLYLSFNSLGTQVNKLVPAGNSFLVTYTKCYCSQNVTIYILLVSYTIKDLMYKKSWACLIWLFMQLYFLQATLTLKSILLLFKILETLRYFSFICRQKFNFVVPLSTGHTDTSLLIINAANPYTV